MELMIGLDEVNKYLTLRILLFLYGLMEQEVFFRMKLKLQVMTLVFSITL